MKSKTFEEEKNQEKEIQKNKKVEEKEQTEGSAQTEQTNDLTQNKHQISDRRQNETKTKRKIYDSVFIDLFSIPENLLDLYKTLLGDKARKDITVDELEIINTEKVIVNDLYNDLSFLVDDELIILVEAQSTYSKNIVTRILFYVAKALEKHLRNQSQTGKLTALYYESNH